MTLQSRGGTARPGDTPDPDGPIPPAPPAGGKAVGDLPAQPVPATAQCHDEVCITCGDTAVAVRILRLLEDEMAVVDTGSGEEEVSVALVSATAGDTILVHAGEAIAVVPE